MLKEMGFSRGVNLGGWMSQCDYSQERLDGFIREEDLARIAGWGLDHVRLPVDYNVLETEDGSGYREEGFGRIRRVIAWCEKYGLNLVIDLHKTAGFSFDSGEMETGFFSSGDYQELVNSEILWLAGKQIPAELWDFYFTDETHGRVAEVLSAYRNGAGNAPDGRTSGLYFRGGLV